MGVAAPRALIPTGGRDPRLDFFRGLALVMIFINHVPGNPLEVLTNRNFGFSDAAEGFVFMSGMAAGLAYPSAFQRLPLWRAVLKCWGRAWTLYSVHLVVSVICLAIMLGAVYWFDAGKLAQINNVEPWIEAPVQATIGIALLSHQFGYVNILSMYAVLLMMTPAMILIAQRSGVWVMLGLSFLLWIVTGETRLNIPAFPNSGGWFFNPFAWQFLFAIGLAAGMRLKTGARLVPDRTWARRTALVLLLLTVTWMKIGVVQDAGRAGLAFLRDSGFPFYITNFDKTFLAAPRLLHFLALAYFLSTQGWVRRLSGHAWVRPVRLMGRFGLPVFALGTVLSILGQSIQATLTGDLWLISLVFVVVGLALQMALAGIKWRLSQAPDTERAAVQGRDSPRVPAGIHAE
ncbi:OpgC domain-containing protein [Thalassococcus profundi]|uniref:OpgC domain-containing protein n=1 Tax=Thalassococcus profundi TaxID=2282382 RepID=A0A369TYG6_9RHOB|nr:OpgC domain-containing protein [Thalassococcus profundi]RDD68006.1 OpgC domain-containing protein [Thalassococcus profundi]